MKGAHTKLMILYSQHLNAAHRFGIGIQKASRGKNKETYTISLLFQTSYYFFLIRPIGNTSSLNNNITSLLLCCSLWSQMCSSCHHDKGSKWWLLQFKKKHSRSVCTIFLCDISRYHFEERSDELFFLLKWQRSKSLFQIKPTKTDSRLSPHKRCNTG